MRREQRHVVGDEVSVVHPVADFDGEEIVARLEDEITKGALHGMLKQLGLKLADLD